MDAKEIALTLMVLLSAFIGCGGMLNNHLTIHFNNKICL